MDSQSKTALQARIANDFEAHRATSRQTEAMAKIRLAARHLAVTMAGEVPLGRELSSALTRLEEAMFHANAGIARVEEEETKG